MKILIDFSQIPLTRTGVGVYADHLVLELLHLLAPTDRLYVLMQDDEVELPRLLPGDSRMLFLTIPARVFRNRLALLAYEQVALPLLLWRRGIDLVHSLHYTFPLYSRCPRVVTIHDLTFFLWPQLHTRARRLLFRPFIRLALRLAEAVVFVSGSTRDDAERLHAQPGQLRFVTPLGVTQTAFVRPSQEDIREKLRSLGLRSPFLLFIGTIEPRKNLLRLIEAFNSLANEFPDLDLVLAGKLGWDSGPFLKAVAASPHSGRVRHLGFVTNDEKQALLAAAKALVYPSLYEGFGLPVLEAMAMGTPVVTSKVSSLIEVAGDAALLVDPASVADLTDAMRRLLTDPSLAASLVVAGPARAHAYTWARTARTTLETYRALSNGTPPCG